MSSGGKRVRWTEFADEVIGTMYATKGARACQALLPDRSIEAIQQRAHKLRVASASYFRDECVKFGYPADDRPDEIKALDTALRCFRVCEPAANLCYSVGVVCEVA